MGRALWWNWARKTSFDAKKTPINTTRRRLSMVSSGCTGQRHLGWQQSGRRSSASRCTVFGATAKFEPWSPVPFALGGFQAGPDIGCCSYGTSAEMHRTKAASFFFSLSFSSAAKKKLQLSNDRTWAQQWLKAGYRAVCRGGLKCFFEPMMYWDSFLKVSVNHNRPIGRTHKLQCSCKGWWALVGI